MRARTRRLLGQRRQFCRAGVKTSDSDFLREMQDPGIPDVLLLAIRRGLATRCGIPPERIHPDAQVDVLRPLMAASLRSACWELDPDDADLDVVEFIGKVEDDCRRSGYALRLGNQFVAKLPEFGHHHGALIRRLLRRPNPCPCVKDWVRATALFIARYGQVVQRSV